MLQLLKIGVAGLAVCGFWCTALSAAEGATVKDADRVMVVRNENSPISKSVADDYAQKRGVRLVVSVRCQDSSQEALKETISYADYLSSIEAPIRSALESHPDVTFIVLTKGIPIRIGRGAPRGMEVEQTAAGSVKESKRPSVDSTLAALDYDKISDAVQIIVKDGAWEGTGWANRFWNSTKPFAHKEFGGYLVTRLDGYTEADAKALVIHALEAEQSKPPADGKILLDICPGRGLGGDRAAQPWCFPPAVGKEIHTGEMPFEAINADMQRAADILKARNIPVELNEDNVFVGNRKNLLGYYSWGSNDSAFDLAAYHSLQFAPGAIGDTVVSTSGRTFLPAQGGQSLIADLIAQGITGIKGYCDEPDGTAIASPSIMFDRYTHGWTLAESFYAASRFVAWEDIVIGDPLCRPYRAEGNH